MNRGILRAAICVTFLTAYAVAADANTWNALDYPGAGDTYANGIDGPNIVGNWYVGDFAAGPYGYSYDGVTWTSRAVPWILGYST